MKLPLYKNMVPIIKNSKTGKYDKPLNFQEIRSIDLATKIENKHDYIVYLYLRLQSIINELDSITKMSKIFCKDIKGDGYSITYFVDNLFEIVNKGAILLKINFFATYTASSNYIINNYSIHKFLQKYNGILVNYEETFDLYKFEDSLPDNGNIENKNIEKTGNFGNSGNLFKTGFQNFEKKEDSSEPKKEERRFSTPNNDFLLNFENQQKPKEQKPIKRTQSSNNRQKDKDDNNDEVVGFGENYDYTNLNNTIDKKLDSLMGEYGALTLKKKTDLKTSTATIIANDPCLMINKMQTFIELKIISKDDIDKNFNDAYKI